jgi:hypothetical protein
MSSSSNEKSEENSPQNKSDETPREPVIATRAVIRSTDLSAKIGGEVGRAPSKGWRAVVRWVTGWAVLCWGARLIAVALRIHHRTEVELTRTSLTCHSRISVLNRLVGESKQAVTWESLARVCIHQRYPTIYLAVGVAALSAGILLGGNFAYEGIVTGNLFLLAGFLLPLVGSLLDLALSIVPGKLRATGAVEIDALPRFSLTVLGVPQADADIFFNQVELALKNRTASTGAPILPPSATTETPAKPEA